jgi:hypothetical protein
MQQIETLFGYHFFNVEKAIQQFQSNRIKSFLDPRREELWKATITLSNAVALLRGSDRIIGLFHLALGFILLIGKDQKQILSKERGLVAITFFIRGLCELFLTPLPFIALDLLITAKRCKEIWFVSSEGSSELP